MNNRQESLRIVLTIPNLCESLSISDPDNPNLELLEDWQKDEVVREIFDRMESNFATFLKNIQMGVSLAHISDKEYSDSQISAINRVMAEVGCLCWFICSQNKLFKTVVDENAIACFIDTFPLFLDVVGEDYVVLQHNELSKAAILGHSMFS